MIPFSFPRSVPRTLAITAGIMLATTSVAAAQTYTRTESITYRDDTANWVLGSVESRSTTGVLPGSPATSVQLERTEFNTQGLPWKTYRFGRLDTTITYNPDGTVAAIADGGGNTTSLSGWKRGIPQTVTFADGTSRAALVNDDATLDWVADEAGYRTCYAYDAMGRVIRVTYPEEKSLAAGAIGNCDTTQAKWAITSISYAPVAAVEYGLPAGHWKQQTITGNAVTTSYLDAFWRPVVTETYDAANPSATRSVLINQYDSSGRKSYTSYPVASATSYTDSPAGTWTTYDALDRVTSVGQDSELGRLTTATAYGSDGGSLWTLVTNPRQQSTRTWFQSFDAPAYDAPIQILQPESALTEISRNSLGTPGWIRRRSLDNSVSTVRQYVYNAYQQLCKTIEPETGATLMRYDAAGNLDLTASGLASSAAVCDYTEAAGRAVTRQYDARGRLRALRFPDAKGDQDWTYTRDGLPDTVTTRNEPGAPIVTNSYVYNSRRQLTGETQSHDVNVWSVGYGYDALGNRASITYPAGLSVTYSPNALGQPTQVSGSNGVAFATNLQYYPNGAMRQFTYGNGLTHTMSQNARQLPATVVDGTVLNNQYVYDANGNVEAIYDNGRGTAYSRWMGYDGLDRLTSAGSASFGGDSWHRFTYDALDNLKSWKLPGVKDYANYYYNPTTGRLDSIQNSAGASTVGIGYDDRGNVRNKNGQTYDFDFGNRLRAALGTELYRYDAYGRRILTRSPTGSSFALYGQEGQLLWERDERAGARLQYVYLNGTILATRRRPIGTDTEVVYYNHNDALGSVVALSDPTGAVAQRSDYEPYGALMGRPLNNRPGYTGHVMDAPTGLTYMQQRYYDPTVGRFLSVDPVTADGNTGGNFNRYKYANNNPYRFTDPDGRQEKEDNGSYVLGFLKAIRDGIAPFAHAMVDPDGSAIDVQSDRIGPGPGGVEQGGYKLGSAWLVAEGARAPATLVGAVVDARAPVALTEAQTASLTRFEKKNPLAGPTRIQRSGENAVFSRTKPGNVPGSSATYTKTVAPDGRKIEMTKTTVDHRGQVPHEKDK